MNQETEHAAAALLTLDIVDIAYRGAGVARHDGWVVFVPGALAGERVEVRVVRRHKQYGEARLLRVLTPSPHRVAPACPLAETCPGCAYQSCAYAEELRVKQAQLAQFLQRQAGVDPAVLLPPLGSPAPAGYRNKITLHGAVQDGLPVLGYVGTDNTTVIDVPACPLAHPALNERLAALRADPRFMAGIRPHLTLTLRHTAADGALDWIGRPAADAPALREASPLGPLAVPRASFYQVNPDAAAALLATVQRWIAETQPRAVVDLYCGVGVFALAAAAAGAAPVMGVDSDEAAIAAARANASALGLNCAFQAGPAQDTTRRALASVEAQTTLLIVDPPRTGLPPRLIRDVLRYRPGLLLYVSCAADTLARDLKQLVTAGYRVERAQLVDMFPRTAYFETAVLLRHPAPAPPPGAEHADAAGAA